MHSSVPYLEGDVRRYSGRPVFDLAVNTKHIIWKQDQFFVVENLIPNLEQVTVALFKELAPSIVVNVIVVMDLISPATAAFLARTIQGRVLVCLSVVMSHEIAVWIRSTRSLKVAGEGLLEVNYHFKVDLKNVRRYITDAKLATYRISLNCFI